VREKIAEIEQIARDNLSKEADLVELKNQVHIVKRAVFVGFYARYHH